MSITAQVDTASIEVSLDMHQLRTEIAEVLGEEFDELMESATPSEHVHIHDRIDEHHKKIKDLQAVVHTQAEQISDLQKSVDELTARIVGAGCMLTGTRT